MAEQPAVSGASSQVAQVFGTCRLRATGRTSSSPLCDLVRDKVIAPEDALPAGLTILAALADLARTSAFSVLDASA